MVREYKGSHSGEHGDGLVRSEFHEAMFGEVHKKASPLQRFRRMNKIGILKPSLNTEPKVFYANLDMEVK